MGEGLCPLCPKAQLCVLSEEEELDSCGAEAGLAVRLRRVPVRRALVVPVAPRRVPVRARVPARAVLRVPRVEVVLRPVVRPVVVRRVVRPAVDLRRPFVLARRVLRRVVVELPAARRPRPRPDVVPRTRLVTFAAALRISPSSLATEDSRPARRFSSSATGMALTKPCTAFMRSPPPAVRRRVVVVERLPLRVVRVVLLAFLGLGMSTAPPCDGSVIDDNAVMCVCLCNTFRPFVSHHSMAASAMLVNDQRLMINAGTFRARLKNRLTARFSRRISPHREHHWAYRAR